MDTGPNLGPNSPEEEIQDVSDLIEQFKRESLHSGPSIPKMSGVTQFEMHSFRPEEHGTEQPIQDHDVLLIAGFVEADGRPIHGQTETLPPFRFACFSRPRQIA